MNEPTMEQDCTYTDRDIQIIRGKRICTWGGWYQQDTVMLKGQKLEGFIQIKRAHKRTQIITCSQDYAVTGYQVQWLLKENHYAIGPSANGYGYSITPIFTA